MLVDLLCAWLVKQRNLILIIIWTFFSQMGVWLAELFYALCIDLCLISWIRQIWLNGYGFGWLRVLIEVSCGHRQHQNNKKRVLSNPWDHLCKILHRWSQGLLSTLLLLYNPYKIVSWVLRSARKGNTNIKVLFVLNSLSSCTSSFFIYNPAICST